MKKSIPYLKTIILVTLVYLITIIILLIRPIEIDVLDFILDGLFPYFAFICLIIVWRLSNISLCLGWLF